MFSKEGRCHYHRAPLAEVICQLRFPEILTIQANAPVDFQEAIREEYPVYLRRQELSAPKLSGLPGNLSLQKQESVNNYQFSSPDGIWRINLTSKFISLTCTNYPCWEEFAAHLDKPLAAFIQIYRPAFFQRVGLRYVNFISRQALELEDVPFRELIRPCYLGPLAEEEIPEISTLRCNVDFETNLRNGCRARIHAGPGKIKRGNKEDPEVKFIFDQDLSSLGQIPPKLSVGTLQVLHHHAGILFRGAVTQRLHEAMEPQD